MKKEYFFTKAAKQSVQIKEDSNTGDLIEPFFNFNELLNGYYYNVYHRRALKIKAGLLSQIEIKQSNLTNFLPTNLSPKNFINIFTLNLELYGNAYLEKSGTANSYFLYNIPANEVRVDKNLQIYQYINNNKNKIEGFHLKYYSPKSSYYGEPDYLASLEQISINKKADNYNSKFFDNGAKPDLAIIYENAEPSEEQITAFRDFFGNSFKGYNNAHKTLILYGDSLGEREAKIRFENLSNVTDLSFKALKEVSRNEIAAAHGVPPRLLGITDAAALGGSGELIGQLMMFNELEIKPKIEFLESFFENIGIKLRLKAMDTTNFKDDGDIVANLVNMGIISVNEARSILGWQKTLQGQ